MFQTGKVSKRERGRERKSEVYACILDFHLTNIENLIFSIGFPRRLRTIFRKSLMLSQRAAWWMLDWRFETASSSVVVKALYRLDVVAVVFVFCCSGRKIPSRCTYFVAFVCFSLCRTPLGVFSVHFRPAQWIHTVRYCRITSTWLCINWVV